MAAVPHYLVVNAVLGAVVGVIFGVVLLITDSLGIRSLVIASGDITATTVIFLVGSAMTFTPFVVATAIMFFEETDL
jgi:hypothetical protein